MEDVVRKLLLYVLLTVFTVSLANAQDDPPCEMDCPDDDWIHKTQSSFEPDPVGCPGCEISFEYWQRENACGIYKDLQLGEITLTSSCLSCYTIDEIVDIAIDKMIKDNELPMPDTGECETNWRAFHSACWGEWTENGDTVIKPCEPAQCCWEVLEVCSDSVTGDITYNVIDSYAPDPEECLYYPYPCEFTCEGAPEPPKISADTEGMKEQNGYQIKAYPNPADNRLILEFASGKTGNFTLQVFDYSGNSLHESEFRKEGDNTFIHLNISEYNSGNYRYVIKRKGNTCVSGSFSIVR